VRTFIPFLATFVLACGGASAQEVGWRFGLEDTWSQFGILNEVQAGEMLDKLQFLTQEQMERGDINVNGTAGGWGSMQPLATSPINFAQSDKLVRLLQSRGFSMLWNLRINAPWSSQANAGCYDHSTVSSCAPDADHEQALYDYMFAIVERYDGDGNMDMGYETPGDTTDDLRVPIQFYLMTGEIEFAGATPEPGSDEGYGDESRSHFWSDNVENLLSTHRILYRAIHDADPTGFSKLVSSGGVFWDLYTDFPDWPDTEGPTVRARLEGQNNHEAVYTESFERLRTMLQSFGDDSDGVECDYIGWHPHMAWREIDQAFAFIRKYAPDLPIYIDDMWTAIFLQNREDAPGNTLFYKGGQPMEGDFPNELVSDYSALRNGMVFNAAGVRDWYQARISRHMVKAFASAFGEGAERVSYSGTADFAIDRIGLTGYVNLLGTYGEGLPEKPAYYTYRLLVDKLHDFTSVEEVDVSDSPLTRAYLFQRPERGPVYVAWSETGGAPPDLDYSIPTGEMVSLPVFADTVLVTYPIEAPGSTEPATEYLQQIGGSVFLQLGYRPVFIESTSGGSVANESPPSISGPPLKANVYPNPFRSYAHIAFETSDATPVQLEVFDALGRRIAVLVNGTLMPGKHSLDWGAHGLSPGLYFFVIRAGTQQVAGTVVKTSS
jgi:hypothetical protein